jgi:hypothetical protein
MREDTVVALRTSLKPSQIKILIRSARLARKIKAVPL